MTLTNVVRKIFVHLRNGQKIVRTTYRKGHCDQALRQVCVGFRHAKIIQIIYCVLYIISPSYNISCNKGRWRSRTCAAVRNRDALTSSSLFRRCVKVIVDIIVIEMIDLVDVAADLAGGRSPVVEERRSVLS